MCVFGVGVSQDPHPPPPQGSQCTTCAATELACAAQVINSKPSQKPPPPITHNSPYYHPQTPSICASIQCIITIHTVQHLSLIPSDPPSIRPSVSPGALCTHPEQTTLHVKTGGKKRAVGPPLFALCLFKCATLCFDSCVPVDVFSPHSKGPYLSVK